MTVRRKRFEEDIAELKAHNKSAKISDVEKEAYIKRILEEIYLSPKKSQDLFEKRLSKKYPTSTKNELVDVQKEESYLRLETYNECLTKLKSAIYIGESTNDYILDLLVEDNLLSKEECSALRYASGGDPNKASVTAVEKIQQAEMNELEK